ncbi:hypothetical protein MXMO3_01719 [Maritalea myrionectae]|uniref:Arc-like DNA binding domain-containing protein n=1 Tax=Maritalea myrionectae TaxID=454601 RepID=A0A2R4ME71_9HYPH|nr:Arc family DNA-binding protein [Maritalea myrionectae]AVX04245.1 hypothetical protein MXMO3_01719 [Maritalea myrionectae]
MKDNPKFIVRFPDDQMRERLKERAQRNYRSMNAELVKILERALASSEAVEGDGLPNNTPSTAN